MNSSDSVPDSKTIWKFRETFVKEEIVKAIFDRFSQALADKDIFANTGQIVDASFVEFPRQGNTQEKKKEI